MSSQLVLTGGSVSEEEAAAALAAVVELLAAEEAAAIPAAPPARGAGWQATARAIVQGLPPGRLPAEPSWGRIERLRRAGRGGTGVVGQ